MTTMELICNRQRHKKAEIEEYLVDTICDDANDMINCTQKIEIAHEVLSTLKSRDITINDQIDIIDIIMKSLLAKKRRYDRRKK